MNIAIIGLGYVGTAMNKLFEQAVVYDEPKVIFCNEFYDIASKMGVNYNELRETWLMDERMGRSHTFVYPDKRGYSGKCLPKDVSALLAQAEEAGVDAGFMKAVREKNEKYR